MRQAGDEIGDARSRPGPLADGLETFFVDIDDHDRPLRCFARMQHLEQIEDADPKFLNRNRIGDPQRGERNQQYEGKTARQSETVAPSVKAMSSEIVRRRERRRARHFSRNARMN